MPKVLSQIQQKLKENDLQEIHNAYAESIGSILHHVIKNIQNIDEATELLMSFLKVVFTSLNQPGKIVQSGAALCLTKIIQNAPVEALKLKLEDLWQGLLEVLNSTNWRAHTQILESLISLLLSVETDFEPYAVNFLPTLLEWMALTEWNTRKIGIDVMYTIAAILGDVITPYTKEILEVLNHCRFDKIKPVREAAIEAINLIKDLDPSVVIDDTFSQDSTSRKGALSKSTVDKPWKKKEKKQIKQEEEPSSFATYSNKDQDEEAADRKISTATKKRLEAIEAKKKAAPTKKPNLNKEKKSIFDLK